jgi:hypothetical protein
VIATIASATARQRTVLRGKILSVVGFERPFVRTDVVIGDETGTINLRFMGRASVPGLELGRIVVVEGTPGIIRGALTMLNPLYSFAAG